MATSINSANWTGGASNIGAQQGYTNQLQNVAAQQGVPDFGGMMRDLDQQMYDLRRAQGRMTPRDFYMQQDDLLSRMKDVKRAQDNYRSAYHLSSTQSAFSPFTTLASPFDSKIALPQETRFGEIDAVRVWRMTTVPLLTSVHFTHYVWTPGRAEELEVDCEKYTGRGFHAWKDLQDANQYVREYGENMLVVGKVKLWGDIIEHERGYRAQFAKITGIAQLFIPWASLQNMQKRDEALKALREAYCDGRV